MGARRPAAGDHRQRSQPSRTHPGTQVSDQLPPHLQVARPAVVVGGVEDEADALGGEGLQALKGQALEDAPPLVARMGGGVDGADRDP